MSSTIVWILDPQPLFRAGLRQQLRAQDFQVELEAASIDDLARTALRSAAPDLIVADAGMGPSAVKELRLLRPDARIVVIAKSARLSELADHFAAGADGYLLRNITPAALTQSLKLVTLGEKVLPAALGELIGAVKSRAAATSDGAHVGGVALSPRELEVARKLALGQSNKSIARDLGIAEHTVKLHLKTVLRKVRVDNRTQIAVWALKHGLNRAA